ncbi:MAG: hypothetical protein HY582_04870, partial [Candidatus Omnitrophica bacterium]|nr:hypothetical protein [Candidatus Omnitrophota bacterium]
MIELLVAIALTAIIATAVATVFEAAMDAWRFGQEIASIEAVAPEFVNRVSEGDYTTVGLVDALTVTSADSSKVSFVSLAMDHFEVDLVQNEDQAFELTRPFQLGAPLPKGQVRLPGEKLFQSVNTTFKPGKDEEPPQEHDRIQFVEEIPEDSEVRVVYRPDYNKVPETIVSFTWNQETKTLIRDFEGESADLTKNSFGVEVLHVEFHYFSNINQEIIPKDPSGVLDESEMRLITAAKVIVNARKDDTKKTITQFINMRNLSWATAGVVISEGTELKIPNSKLIKSLALVNVSGVSEKSDIRLLISSAFGKSWALTTTYDVVDEKPMLVRYQVEYPDGTTVIDQSVEQPAANTFSLLTLDNQSLFDYDDDEGVEDKVIFEDDD